MKKILIFEAQEIDCVGATLSTIWDSVDCMCKSGVVSVVELEAIKKGLELCISKLEGGE